MPKDILIELSSEGAVGADCENYEKIDISWDCGAAVCEL